MSGSVLFYGSWASVDAWLIKNQVSSLNKAMKKPMETLGHAVSLRLQQHIQSQDLPWEELAPETVAKKGHSLVYIDKMAYFKGIRYKVTSQGRKKITMLVYPKGIHAPSGRALEKLAFDLEYGTSRIPERALWRPTYAEMFQMKEFRDLVKQAMDLGFSEAARGWA
jgi:hypothetical protein